MLADVLSVPAVMVRLPVMVNALPRVNVDPVLLKTTPHASETPFVVTVRLAAPVPKVIVPVALQTFEALSEKFPETVGVPVLVKVAAGPVEVRSKHVIAPLSVTVYANPPVVEFASKMALSAAVGTVAPIVAAVIACEATVPLPDVVHVLPDPPVIVPKLVFVASHTVMPMTSAGLPTVVSVVPLRDPVNATALAADHLVVPPVTHVPEPPTQ